MFVNKSERSWGVSRQTDEYCVSSVDNAASHTHTPSHRDRHRHRHRQAKRRNVWYLAIFSGNSPAIKLIDHGQCNGECSICIANTSSASSGTRNRNRDKNKTTSFAFSMFRPIVFRVENQRQDDTRRVKFQMKWNRIRSPQCVCV